VYQKLREGGLVSNELDAALSALPIKRLVYTPQVQFLYSLNDEFMVNFGIKGHLLCVLTEQEMVRLPFYGQFSDTRSHRGQPYTGAYSITNSPYCLTDNFPASIGTAMVRFERSTETEHLGTKTVVLRFLKMTTPVKCVIPQYDGYVGRPEEGRLYYRQFGSFKPHPRLWSADIDKPKGVMLPGLRLLWNA
jgi:hypothetical protein